MHIAYLLNQYPYISCTFIRREIAELEKLGLHVSRFAIRPTEHQLSDRADLEELRKTRCVLKIACWRLVGSLVAVALTRPLAFLRAARLAFRMSRRSPRGLVVHLAYLIEACVVFRWCIQLGVTHVHSHFGTNAPAVAMLCRVLGGPPYSFTVHGPQDFDLAYALSFDEKISRAQFVVAISHFAKSQLFRWCRHCDWSKINIVRCGVSPAYLDVPVPDVARLLNIGRLSEQKGQILLMEAAHELRCRSIHFELNLVGDGEDRAVLEEIIARYALTDSVRLLGWQTEAQVQEQIRQCRLVVLPSFAEGLPVVLMEALAMGRPVITTSIAGIPELVQHKVSGWLIPPGSVEALVSAVCDGLATPVEQLNQMGRAGAAAVARHHSVATEAARLAELFHGNCR
jgi:glycosyltransferase involved in cell wall biosynthesis